MSIAYHILGNPGEDNALHLTIDTGQSQHQLLFDCGEAVLKDLPISEIQAIEHLCFSHFHMDHVCGFDTFFRHNYNREGTPVSVWGPEGTVDLMHHRFQGFSWNLNADQPGEWKVGELSGVGPNTHCSRAARFLTHESFAMEHKMDSSQFNHPFVHNSIYQIEACRLDHGSIPSIAYKVIESERKNIDLEKLTQLGLQPGPWLGQVNDNSLPDDFKINPGTGDSTLGQLRNQLIKKTPGDSIAYLSDFILPPSEQRDAVVDWLKGTQTLVSESQYLHRDIDLAEKNSHMTTQLVAELAHDASVGQLVIQHVSRRYSSDEWLEMLTEARSIFPATGFPSHWRLKTSTTQ